MNVTDTSTQKENLRIRNITKMTNQNDLIFTKNGTNRSGAGNTLKLHIAPCFENPPKDLKDLD